MCEKTMKINNCRASELLDNFDLRLIDRICKDVRTRNLLVQRAPSNTVLVVDGALGAHSFGHGRSQPNRRISSSPIKHQHIPVLGVHSKLNLTSVFSLI